MLNNSLESFEIKNTTIGYSHIFSFCIRQKLIIKPVRQCFYILLLSLFISATNIFPSQNHSLPDSIAAGLNSLKLEDKIAAYCDVMNYYNRFMPEKSIEYGNKALQLARENKYQKGESDILFLFGVCNHAQSNFTEAMEYFQASLSIRNELKDNVGIGKCMSRIGLMYNVLGNYEKALDNCLQAVNILEHENDKKALGAAYNYLGITYYILNDSVKAKEISFKALKFNEKINEDVILAVSNEHLGIIYIKSKEYDKAIPYIQESLRLRLPLNDRVGIAGAYENLAIIYRFEKKYDKALEYYTKSLELKRELNNQRGMASTFSGIGVIYFNMGEYEKSLSFQMESYELRKLLGDKRGIVSSLNRVADSYSSMGNYKSALEYYKLGKIYSDSLLNEQKNKAIAEFQETFQREKREKEILLLQKENTNQKYIRNSLLIMTVLLLTMAISILIAYRSKRKVNSILSNHNSEITKQKEELQLLNEQLSALNFSKDKFFSIIAHDLKSPFQGFLGLTEILAEDGDSYSVEKLSTLGKSMNQSANNLFNLLKNLLEWSQMQRGSISFLPEEISLTKLIATSIETFQERAEQKGIATVNLVAEPVQVYADEKMITSVLLNLLSNALKFTYRNGTITINATKTSEKAIEISIRDTGIGMSQKDVERLFKIGEKVGAKGTEGELSTGLGLLLCKEFVEKNGGHIWVESEEGKGSIFYFSLRTNFVPSTAV